MSMDNGSPFKPKRVLRRSFGGSRKDQIEEGSERPMDTEIAEEDEEDVYESEAEAGADAEAGSDELQPIHNDQPDEPSSDDDAPPVFDNNEDFYDAQRESDDAEINEALEHAESILQATPTTAPPTAKARGLPRKSDQTSVAQHSPETTQATSSSRKRDRTEMEEEENVADDDDTGNHTLQSIEQSQNEVPHVSATSDNAPKRKRGRPRKSDNNESSQASVTTDNTAKRKPGRPRKSDISVLQDPVNVDETHQGAKLDGNVDGNDTSQVSAAAENPARKRPGRPRKSDVTIAEDNGGQTVHAGDLAHGDSYLAPINEDDEVEAAPASPVTKKKPGRKPKAQKATKSQKAPKERDSNQSMRQTPTGSPGKANGRDLALSRSPSKRAGSVSNVNLRASTPFEDAHQRMSRSGRPILAPLKHWAGESYVWKNGEVEGIIRADDVKTPRGDKKKKAKGRRRVPRAGGRGTGHDLDNIAEESDTESTVPDEWEDQVGVIAGTVAAWDPESQEGIPEDPIREGTFIEGFAA
jgi:centromere protein C